ncbi:S41 family peptidase [Peribacillus frigoritolerans]|nr:S41 family peptidase [Peribacillus frigoritolerans]
MLDDGVAKIQVTSFSEHTVQELKTALEEMSKKDMKGLVLDLRGKPGGTA